MRKQLFLLFYSEDEKNDTNAKLVMTFVNRFIIDEDAECEVIEVNRVPELKYFEFGIIQKLKFLCSIVLNFRNIIFMILSNKQLNVRYRFKMSSSVRILLLECEINLQSL